MKEIIEGAIEKIAAGAEKEALEQNVILGAQELEQIQAAAGCTGLEQEIAPVILDGKEGELGRQGGLAACNWKCLTSYCYPADLAKRINSSNPHAANSSVGHS